MKKLTDQHKVIRVLIEQGPRWMHSYELIGDWNGTFLSHRGPARISELSLDYPEMIETDRTQKTYRYRFRFDNTLNFWNQLGPEMSEFVKSELKINGHQYQEEITEYIPNPDGSSVRPIKRVITI